MAIYTKDKDSGQLKRIAGDGPTIVNPLLDYSMEEQDTGQKWIDGKSIYQKTLQLNLSGIIANTWNVIGTIANLIPGATFIVSGSMFNESPIGIRTNGLNVQMFCSESPSGLKFITLWYEK